jgi:hypothetical protein
MSAMRRSTDHLAGGEWDAVLTEADNDCVAGFHRFPLRRLA